MSRSSLAKRWSLVLSCLALCALGPSLWAGGNGKGGGGGGGGGGGPPPDWAFACTGWGGYIVGPIILMTEDGAQNEKLTGFDIRYQPRWSPDGTRLAFWLKKAFKGNPLGIYTIGVDGSGMTLIHPGGPLFSLDWSPMATPDGRDKIVFVDDRDLFLINPDGSGLQNLTAGTPFQDLAYPAWDPTGSRIVATDGVGGAWVLELGLVGGQLAITSGWDLVPSGPLSTVAALMRPCWSPADDCILIEAWDIEGSGVTDLWRVDLDTLDQTWLAPGASPDLNADGTEVLFVQNGDLWHMMADGTGAQPFLHGRKQGATNPSWRPGY